jgi:antitoxin component of RelBE/YafQ-DinJ toxin-antitoxin module
MSEEEKDKLFDILNRLGLTVDQVTDMFLRWVIENPDEAGRWLKEIRRNNI